MNKQIIYIIPGLGETWDEPQNKELVTALEKNYTVRQVNPNWYAPLSSNVFEPEESAILFGFSMGAILAYLIAKKYKVKGVLFASPSPIHDFTERELLETYSEYMRIKQAKKNAKDILKIKFDRKKIKGENIVVAGANEEIDADYYAIDGDHFLSKGYRDAIVSLLMVL